MGNSARCFPHIQVLNLRLGGEIMRKSKKIIGSCIDSDYFLVVFEDGTYYRCDGREWLYLGKIEIGED